MKFEKISEDFIYDVNKSPIGKIAEGPRCVRTNDNKLICTFFAQSTHGINDFEVMYSISYDNGDTWTESKTIWPELRNLYSIACSISRSRQGELFLYGTRTLIEQPGEPNWCEATQGLKQNELIYARSKDNGNTWTEPEVIPMPIPGSAEAPGTMCILSNGRWIAPYSPYNTFDTNLKVERNQVIVMYSDDRGRTWSHSSMLKFDDTNANGAEAWVVELSDGRLLGTSWHLNQNDGSDYPNAFAISRDCGVTWSRTMSTGIQGQATALAALDNGKGLFIYNQRKHGQIGVWMALVNPTETDFGIEANEVIWAAERKTKSGMTSGGHSEWRDFAFGEPSVMVLDKDTLLVTLWCIQPSGSGIRYVKLKMNN